MGEAGYMDDAEFDIERDIRCMYRWSSTDKTTNECLEELSIMFKKPIDEIRIILSDCLEDDDLVAEEQEESKIDYLSILTTNELNGIYAVLARQCKTDSNDVTMRMIEEIILERNQSNE